MLKLLKVFALLIWVPLLLALLATLAELGETALPSPFPIPAWSDQSAKFERYCDQAAWRLHQEAVEIANGAERPHAMDAAWRYRAQCLEGAEEPSMPDDCDDARCRAAVLDEFAKIIGM